MNEPQPNQENPDAGGFEIKAPAISLPKGGGAIHGMGEKFSANPVTGTGSLSVPIATSPGRGGFGPQLNLSYDSGAGNGPFGLGWNLSLPSITRKTEKGLPQYNDAAKSDVFILSGAEDLVPVLLPADSTTFPGFVVERYRPRIEGLFARIERWTERATGETHWRSISKDHITMLYGRQNDSRIFDPQDLNPPHPSRVFSWLICQSYDDKGNAILYQYAAENDQDIDPAQANERNRVRTANRYLKRIFYGNRTPNRDPQGNAIEPALLPADTWMFEVVFDYGEHNQAVPTPKGPGIWPRRSDPFSSYRAGFEVRTYRLCQRVLMFHHIPDDPLPGGQLGYDGLVRSTDFTYGVEPGAANAHLPVFSKLTAVTQTGYQPQAAGGYLARSLPPIEFGYSQAALQAELRELQDDSLENLPAGIDGSRCQWIDLDGEGLSGVLSEQAGAWFYKRNLSPAPLQGPQHPEGAPKRRGGEAQFAPVELIASRPNLASPGLPQFLDLAGDGRPDAVQFDGATPGFYERTMDGQWDAFVPFSSLPQVNWADPNLKFVDLDGDGHADVLISEQDAFVWHPSLGEAGFSAARRFVVPGEGQRAFKALDEESGPRIVFADGEQCVYLSDMSGDGLADIARIRNGEICYWPNLGYGRFGAKVSMDHAPLFDHPDQFDQRLIRLADIDGTGTTDIVYLHRDGARVYFNQSGNSWSAATPLQPFPAIDNASGVQVLDLLGNGTACLVWSSPLPGAARRPLRYLDLMGGQKPHLLVRTNNNLGLETTIAYAPSTQFYLQDQQAGQPWITKLPFPVHCVEKVTVTDRWRKTSFSTRYSYHHGYFDGPEREFRGFGRVEQVDVEDYGTFATGNVSSPYITPDKTLYQPPIKTVTWYHTGAFLDRERILSQFKHEHFPNGFGGVLGSFRENLLPEPDLAQADLTADEWHEALRACKGMLLRQEIYELDVDALARGEQKPVRLFAAADHNCHIRRLQPRAANPHAVFLVTESEALIYHYELDLRPSGEAPSPDPRITHTLNLSSDEYGNIQQSVAVTYPRIQKFEDGSLPAHALNLIRQVQSELHLAYTETRYTNDVPEPGSDGPHSYRLRLPCEVLTYELTGKLSGVTAPAENAGQLPADIAARYFTLAELRAYRLSDKYQVGGLAVENIAYHQLPDRSTPQMRLVEHTRTLFFKETLDGPEPLGKLNRLALPYENYKLALTADLLNRVFADKLTPDVQTVLSDKNKSGYLSGADLTARFGAAAPGQFWMSSGVVGFNADASRHFYLPERYTDPFGNPTLLDYDPRDLFIRSSQDALGSRGAVLAFDCRVLAPSRMQDINDNLTEVRFDALGMPSVMAVLGKGDEGDNLTGFDLAALNPEPATRSDFFVTSDYSAAQAKSLLGNATARHLYYFGEVILNGKTVWGQHPPCAAGIAREQHAAANPNSPVQASFEYSDGAGNLLVKKVQAEPGVPGAALRWVAGGKTILNNKGKPVQQYEPYFSRPVVGHRYNGEEAEHAEGVTPVLYYDALGRMIRSEAPDGSYSRVEFSPWQSASYDANDTLLEANNAWFALKSSPAAAPQDQRAARLAAGHANTPALTVLDSLGRAVIAVAHNRSGPANAPMDEKQVTFSKLDAEGKPLWVQDARGNRVLQYITPPLPEGQHRFDDDQNLNPRGFAPCYDIAGNLLFQHSMEAGERWMLNDAAGKPLFAWNSRGFFTRFEYDALHRPTASFAAATGPATFSGAPRNPLLPPDPPRLVERLIYGEGQPNDKKFNLRGRPYQHSDTAGVVTVADYDFKGNPLSSRRELLADYKSPPDWTQNPALDAERFTTSTAYDALNRPVRITAPDGSVTQPEFNEANLLNALQVTLKNAAQAIPFVNNIDYNAKGQRERIEYGSGAATTYAYDAQTFRLTRLKTTRPNQPDAVAAALFASPTVVQDLSYTYDPLGNITRISDAAHQTLFFDNQQVAAVSEYAYDALYRLTAASGRERKAAPQYGWDDQANTLRMPPNGGSALGCYVEVFGYDAVGNIMQMAHHTGSNAGQPGTVAWKRRYQYAQESNRLLATSLPGDLDGSFSEKYTYDLHGNMATLPHLPAVQWDYKDQLCATSQQVVNDGTPEMTYYVYDSSGQRVRKVTERQAAAGQLPTRSKQRLYLGGFEVYREYENDGVAQKLARETLHVRDDQQRIALVETRTLDVAGNDPAPQQLIRCQFGNHLGSASLELDDRAQVIAYEEYTPYGSTAYQALRSQTDTPKRYRYTGKERDEETGFAYHEARYYLPWLARWLNPDPKGASDGVNLYRYCRGNPITHTDPGGTTTKSLKERVNEGFRKDLNLGGNHALVQGSQGKPNIDILTPGAKSAVQRPPEPIDKACAVNPRPVPPATAIHQVPSNADIPSVDKRNPLPQYRDFPRPSEPSPNQDDPTQKREDPAQADPSLKLAPKPESDATGDPKNYRAGDPKDTTKGAEASDILERKPASDVLDAAGDEAEKQWNKASTGENVLVVGAAVVVGGGAVAGVAANKEATNAVLEAKPKLVIKIRKDIKVGAQIFGNPLPTSPAPPPGVARNANPMPRSSAPTAAPPAGEPPKIGDNPPILNEPPGMTGLGRGFIFEFRYSF